MLSTTSREVQGQLKAGSNGGRGLPRTTHRPLVIGRGTPNSVRPAEMVDLGRPRGLCKRAERFGHSNKRTTAGQLGTYVHMSDIYPLFKLMTGSEFAKPTKRGPVVGMINGTLL